jgi:succinyl-diaminopimelate desuccinylase
MLQTIHEIIDASEAELLRLQRDLVAIPALGPTNDGQGEAEKVAYLREYAGRFQGVTVDVANAPDNRVPGGYRPTLIIRRPGQTVRTLWLIAHTDVVPVGDRALWTGDPFVLRRDGDLIRGRGVEDNHQGIVSALLLLRALEMAQTTPSLSLGIILAADEETGNTFGMEYILEHHVHHLAQDDLVIIPDFGTPRGDAIELAEKSVLWLTFTIQGKQCHASTPDQGINSLTACADLILELESLPRLFGRQDPLFDPPASTFVPTKKEANVPNINTLPGQDVFSLDCRILPSYDLKEIEDAVASIRDTVEARRGVRIGIEPVVRVQAAPATSAECAAAQTLRDAIRATRGLEPKLIGIGGGTVAASFRKRGLSAVCWSTLLNSAHQPDEFSSIANTLADAKTFAHVLFADLGVRA